MTSITAEKKNNYPQCWPAVRDLNGFNIQMVFGVIQGIGRQYSVHILKANDYRYSLNKIAKTEERSEIGYLTADTIQRRSIGRIFSQLLMKFRPILGLYLLCCSLTVHAGIYTAPLTSAMQWLVANQNADGSWGATQDIQPVYTSVAVRALHSASMLQSTYYAGLTWLENHNSSNVDLISRQANALASHGDNLDYARTYLQNAQAHNGSIYAGWGLSPIYSSSAIDTALALIAYTELGSSVQIQPAINFLKSSQRIGANDQGWATNNAGSSDPAVTALVIQALGRYTTQDATLTAVINNGLNTLSTLVTSDMPPVIQALAAQAAQDAGNSALATTFLSRLTASQSVDGSWNADPYATALAARAMASTTSSPALSLVSIPDQALRRAINLALGRNAMDSITMGEMARLTSLSAVGAGIADLTGLQSAINLTSVNLNNNNLKSIAPLTGLTHLASVSWKGNPGHIGEQLPALLLIMTGL